jgi:hypothetical protein
MQPIKKLIRLLLACFFSSYSFAQVNKTKQAELANSIMNFDFEKELKALFKPEFPIDSSNSFLFYQKANRVADSVEDINYVLQADRILYELNQFDHKTYSYDLLSVVYKKLEKKLIAYHLEKVLGEWKSESQVDNWFGKVYNPNSRITFTPTQMFYYKNDSLKRTTGYTITNNPQYKHKLLFYLTVQFDDNKEQWNLIIMNPGSTVPSHGIAKKPYLYFNRDLGCVCGCSTELFSKRKPIEGIVIK